MALKDNMILYEEVLINHTPAMIGGASGGWLNIDGSIDYPRPTDIAGKTRWWLRSILAAGIYELYGVGVPINRIDILAGELMGKIKPSHRAMASKIIIELKPENPWNHHAVLEELKVNYRRELCKLAQKHGIINKPPWPRMSEECLIKLVENNGECPEGEEACCAIASPRVLLEVIGKSIKDAVSLLPIPPGKLRLMVRVKKRIGAELNEVEERILGLAVGLALYASGIGRAQSRGYGKLKPPEDPGVPTNVSTTLSDAVEEVYAYLSRDGHGWVDIAKQAVEVAIQYLEQPGIEDNVNKIISQKTSDKPMTRALHPKTIDVWSNGCVKICLIEGQQTRCLANQTWCTVAAISQAVTKQSMKIYLAQKSGELYSGKDPRRLHGAPIITMYLGMERSAKKGNKVTGYTFTKDYDRMSSPLIFVPLEQQVSSILLANTIEPSLLEKHVKYSTYHSRQSIKELLCEINEYAHNNGYNGGDVKRLLNFISNILDIEYFKCLYKTPSDHSTFRMRFFAKLANLVLGLEKVVECEWC